MYEKEINGILYSEDKAKLQIEVIHSFLKESYWAKNIPKERVKKGIENSITFGVYKNNSQIGFARVISDKCVHAYIADVFIIEEERGKGYSKELMNFILHHPELNSVKKWLLATKDAHKLYHKFGFDYLKYPETFMEFSTFEKY